MTSQQYKMPDNRRSKSYSVEHAIHLAMEAASDAISLLQTTELPSHMFEIFVETENGVSTRYVPIPSMRCEALWNRLNEVQPWTRTPFLALCDHLWENGCFRGYFGRHGKDLWSRNLWGDVVNVPVLRAQLETHLRVLGDGEDPATWTVAEDLLGTSVSEVFHDEHARATNGIRVVSWCLLQNVKILAAKEILLSEHVWLHKATTREILQFLSKFQTEFAPREILHSGAAFGTAFPHAMLEIRGTFPKLKDESDAEARKRVVTSTLDCVNHALMAATQSYTPPVGLKAIIESHYGHAYTALDRWGTRNQFPSVTLDDGIASQLQERFSRISSAVTESPTLSMAIELEGRSAANLSYDSTVLDVVKGLERIAAPTSGESRFRVSLLVAVLLGTSAVNAMEVRKAVRDLYDIRSAVAHGRSASVTGSTANEARKTLTLLIERVLDLNSEGQIGFCENVSGQMCEQLLILVVERMFAPTLRTTAPASETR